MGRPKALLPTGPGGEPFISRIVRVLRDGGVDDVLVVVAERTSPIADAAAALDRPPRVLVNPEADSGQLSSLQTGLRAVDHPGTSGLLVTLVDIPLVSTATVKALLNAYRETRAPVVRPVRGGRHGHPVIFDRAVFDELRTAGESSGAKSVVRAHLQESVDVPIDDEGPFRDVDTPADYAELFKEPVPDSRVGEDG